MNSLAVENCYRDMENLIYSQVHSFIRRYGHGLGTWEEILSHAHEHFLRAYHSYDPKRAAFSTWTGRAVHFGLLTELRRKMKRDRIKSESIQPNTIEQERSCFDLAEFLEDLSHEARTLAQIVLESPADLRAVLTERDKGEHPCNVRKALVQLLKDCGWGARQIADSFSEIREALQ